MVETYFPATWEEVLKIRQKTNALVYAGGTDLMVKKKNEGLLLPKFEFPVLFIGSLQELKQIQIQENRIAIGAACTYDALLRAKETPEILKLAVREIASPAIRNSGTLGGNMCNASPAGDTLPVLYALGASLLLESQGNRREVLIENFILGAGKIALEENEIVKEIYIPKDRYEIQYYKKVGARKADAISKLSFVGLMKTKDDVIEDIRIAFGAVGPRVVRSKEIEKQLIGKNKKEVEAMYSFILKQYGEWITPIDDKRSTASYRKAVSLRLLQDFLLHSKTM